MLYTPCHHVPEVDSGVRTRNNRGRERARWSPARINPPSNCASQWPGDRAQLGSALERRPAVWPRAPAAPAPGARQVFAAAEQAGAQVVLLAGDIFDHNRQPLAFLDRAARLLADAGRPVVILPGNHDPLTPDSVCRRG